MKNFLIHAKSKKIYLIPIVSLLAFCILILWASVANLDQLSRASGQIIAQSRTQIIQSANDGVVEKVHKQEGTRVSKGELLASLVKSQADAAYKDSLSKVAALKAALVRLRAEVYGKQPEFGSELAQYPEFVSNQKQLFERRQKALKEEVSALDENLRLAKQELSISEPLLAYGDIGKSDIIKLKRQISEINGQISKAKNKYFQDAQAEMTKAEEELATKEQELADRSVTLERTEIRAPMDGIVKNIVVTTSGARVRAGDTVMELVPLGDELIFEAKLNPSELSFVKIGDKTSIKLDAYDYSIYGTFKGMVSYISPDSLIEKTSQGDKPYFRIQIKIDKNSLAKNSKNIKLEPGATGTVEIKTDERSVLGFILKPLIKTFSEAFHER